MEEKLAIHGGRPVRDIHLPPAYPGASVYGEEEKCRYAQYLLALGAINSINTPRVYSVSFEIE